MQGFLLLIEFLEDRMRGLLGFFVRHFWEEYFDFFLWIRRLGKYRSMVFIFIHFIAFYSYIIYLCKGFSV